MNEEIVAAISAPYGVIELQLHENNTYTIVLAKGGLQSVLHSGVYSRNLNSELAVIQDNEPKLHQGFRLIVIQE